MIGALYLLLTFSKSWYIKHNNSIVNMFKTKLILGNYILATDTNSKFKHFMGSVSSRDGCKILKNSIWSTSLHKRTRMIFFNLHYTHTTSCICYITDLLILWRLIHEYFKIKQLHQLTPTKLLFHEDHDETKINKNYNHNDTRLLFW